mmetsp:Transcript_16616/g.29089  ORF Transcript_16616/g.29089 Transcript_16616/m.29089 type:complete len:674 (-) Transcript_16616:117-2138(-)
MPAEDKAVMLPAEAVGKAAKAPVKAKVGHRVVMKASLKSRTPVTIPVNRLLYVGQDIIARCGSSWQEVVIVKKHERRDFVDVVTKSGWREHRVPLAHVAVPLRAPKKRPVATPQPARLRAPELQNPASLILKRSCCRPLKAGLDTKVMKETDEALHAKVDATEAPGVISVVFRHGVLAHLDCYGYADLERKVPMRPDSIVRLYSMSKCIVSVAAAMCMEDGLFKLEDEVSEYIPAFAKMQVKTEAGELIPAERPITVLHLLTHTSGLGYGPMLGDEPDGEAEERYVPLIERASLGRTNPGDPEAVKTLEQWCQEFAKLPLHSHPGTEWLYSYSHDVVGRVIEVTTGQRLDAFLQKRLLGPLGMVDTGFEIPREKWSRTAGMYRRNEVPVTKAEVTGAAAGQAEEAKDEEAETVYELARIDAAAMETNEWLAGNASPILAGGGSVEKIAGGLVSTAMDYSRFCLMLLRKGELDGVRLLKPESVELLLANQLPGATGKDDVWAFSTAGVGFNLLGSVSVAHPELDEALRPGEYGWGGMAGTAWTNDPKEDFFLLSFSLTAFDLTTEEVLREGVRKAISEFDKRKERALQARLDRHKRMEERRQMLQAQALLQQSSPAKLPSSPSRKTPTPSKRRKSGTPSSARTPSTASSAKKVRTEPEVTPKRRSAARELQRSP